MRRFQLIVKGSRAIAENAAAIRRLPALQDVREKQSGTTTCRIAGGKEMADAIIRWFKEDLEAGAPYPLGSLLWYREERS